jgi:hypothetical protein
MSKQSCQHRTGMRRVSLQVSEEDYVFAQAMSDHHGYFGPEDYLNGLLNMALIREMDEESPSFWDNDIAIPAEIEDLDDDIPF